MIVLGFLPVAQEDSVEPLFLPRVSDHVVSTLLPETRLVSFHEFHAVNPLGALPCIELGDDQS